MAGLSPDKYKPWKKCSKGEFVVPMFTCITCGIEKPEEDFNKNKNRALGRSSTCKECHNKKQQEKRSSKPKEIKVGGNSFKLYAKKEDSGLWVAWTLDTAVYGVVRQESFGKSKGGAIKALQNHIKRMHQKEIDPPRSCAYCGKTLVWNVDHNLEGESYFHYKRRKYCDLVCSGKSFGEKRTATLLEAETRKCQRCGETKPIDEFSNVRVTKSGAKKFGYCKVCASEVNRERNLREKFSITLAEYDKLLDFSNGSCFVCGAKPRKTRLSVDHDHKTGLIRGLLCHICNKTLGAFRDEPEVLKRLISYLTNPPASSILGEERFGVKGKTTVRKKKSKE